MPPDGHSSSPISTHPPQPSSEGKSSNMGLQALCGFQKISSFLEKNPSNKAWLFPSLKNTEFINGRC